MRGPMRRAGRHARTTFTLERWLQWSTGSPGANLDSEAGPERVSAEGESQG